MHQGLLLNAVANYFVTNIVLPVDEENMNAITYFELNQFMGGNEYKVCTSFVYVIFEVIELL